MTVCGLDHSGSLMLLENVQGSWVHRNVSYVNVKSFDVIIAAKSYDWCAVNYT